MGSEFKINLDRKHERLGSDDATGWIRQPYGVALGASYSTYREELIAQLTMAMNDTQDADKAVNALAAAEKENGSGLVMYNTPSVSDSSIFGNDVINPYAGFCRDDDIVHRSYTTHGDVKGITGKDKDDNDYLYGTGRVYGEIYDTKQQVLYMQFGLPKYRNLTSYLANAYDSDMGELNENGDPGLVKKLGSLVKGGVILAIELPWLPLEWAWKGLKSLGNLNSTKVTEYFYFDETMMLYWRHVNQLLAEIAVAMGIWTTDGYPGLPTKVGDKSIPTILRGGPDIFKILSVRSSRFDAKSLDPVDTAGKSTDDLLADSLRETSNTAATITDPVSNEPKPNPNFWSTLGDWCSNFWKKGYAGFKTSLLDANKFLALRIEKGSDNANETWSNSIQESSIQQRLNSAASETRDRNRSIETASTGMMAGVTKAVRHASQAASMLKGFFTDPGNAVPNIISYAAAGNGFFDLPQQWSGSNFSRSCSVTIRLRSKTGADPISIFTSIMVPLACLIAGAAPRQSGDSTYTAPFICRCWCRGMFTVPAGIVQSLSITRGDSEFGWTLGRLPTVVSVSMQIADLSPILFIGLSGSSVWNQAFSSNSKLHEYINTLTGLGIKQRYSHMAQLRRNVDVWLLIRKNTTFSPTFQGMRFGDSVFGRTINAFMPIRTMRIGN